MENSTLVVKNEPSFSSSFYSFLTAGPDFSSTRIDDSLVCFLLGRRFRGKFVERFALMFLDILFTLDKVKYEFYIMICSSNRILSLEN